MDLAIVALLAILPCGALAAQNVSMKRRIARLEAVASESPSLMLGLSKWDGMPALKAAQEEKWDGYVYTGPEFKAPHSWYDSADGRWRVSLTGSPRVGPVRPLGERENDPKPKRVKKIKTEAEMRRILGCLE